MQMFSTYILTSVAFSKLAVRINIVLQGCMCVKNVVLLSYPLFLNLYQSSACVLSPTLLPPSNFVLQVCMCVIMVLSFFCFCLRRSFLLEDRCRFLSNFSLATADMDIPGEYLMPKTMPYYVRIARFMPRVEIVQRHHSTVRRLYIQGDNGKASLYRGKRAMELHCNSMAFLEVNFTPVP